MPTPITDPAQLPPAFEKAMNSGNPDEVLRLLAPGAVMRTSGWHRPHLDQTERSRSSSTYLRAFASGRVQGRKTDR